MAKVHITLVGKEVLPAYYLIKKFLIKDVYIIHTKENVEEQKHLKTLLDYAGFICIPCQVDAFDLNDVIAICEAIHQKYNQNEVFSYNITGGTKPMAIGAMKVAEKHGSEIYYTESTKLIDINTLSTQELEVAISSKEIFLLQRQQLREYKEYDGGDISLVNDANRIMQFVKGHYKEYQKIMREYRTVYNGSPLPKVKEIGNVVYSHSESGMEVRVNEEICLQIYHPYWYELFFEGRWWETLVAESIYQWCKGKYEIWHSVKFRTKEENNDKNEIDVLLNVGNTLIFIECKSGLVTQDNIYKMDYVRKTYGSDKSKSVLVSYYPINKKDILEKANDSQIDVIVPLKGRDSLQLIPKRLEKVVKSVKL